MEAADSEDWIVRIPTGLGGEHHRVDVWRVGLSSQRWERIVELLDPGEFESIEGMVEPQRSRKWLARASLRLVLSRYLGVPPAAVRFTYGPYGKPAVESDLAPDDIDFNVSSSGDSCLIAVSRCGPVGIDIEAVVPIPDAGRIARRFFTPAESMALEADNGGDVRIFLRYWTAKEAFAKALGVGLSGSLAELPVPSDIHHKEAVTVGDPEGGQWILVPLDVGSGAVATLAVPLSADATARIRKG